MIWIAVVLSWITVLYRIRSTLRHRLAWWSIALTVGVLGCSLGLTVYAIRVTSNSPGPANVLHLGTQVPLTVAAAGIQAWTLSLVRSPLPRWAPWATLVVAAGTITGMCAAWMLSALRHLSVQDASALSGHVAVRVYYGLFYGYGALACLAVAAVAAREQASSRDRLQRGCLRLLAAGGALMVVWLAASFVYIVRGGEHLAGALRASLAPPMSMLSLGILGMSVACTVTRVVTSSWTIASVWRLRRRLLSLAPDVRLPAGPRISWSAESLELVAERCLIEISDASVKVRVEVPQRPSRRDVVAALKRGDGSQGLPVAAVTPGFSCVVDEHRYLRRLGRAYW